MCSFMRLLFDFFILPSVFLQEGTKNVIHTNGIDDTSTVYIYPVIVWATEV